MLKLKNITKKYDREIFKNLSIEFPSSGLVLIVGRSGSGKTTLINLILGVDLDYEGEVIYNNSVLRKKDILSFRRNEVSCVFQDYGLIEHYSIKQNLMLSGLNIKKKISDNDLIELLKKVGINKKLNTICSSLSGGEKQRVAIARSILIDKNIYLCDEPTGSLDKDNGENIFLLLKEISKERLVICVSHNENFIEKYSDYTYNLDLKRWIVKKEDCFRKVYLNYYEESNISFISKLCFSYRSILFHKVRSIVSIVACTIIFLVMIISFSLSSSVISGFDDSFANCLNYNMLEVSNVVETSSNNGFSIKKMVRPDKQVLTNNLKEYEIELSYNFSFLFSIEDVNFVPFNYLEKTRYSFILNKKMEYTDVFVNQEAYDLLDKKVDLNIKKSIKTEDSHFNKAIDNVDISLKLNVIDVISEFELFKIPVVYYNYDLFQKYLSSVYLENASSLLGRKVSLFDRISSLSSDNEELTSYSFLVWANENDVSFIRDYLRKKGYDVNSISLDNKDYLIEVINVIKNVINLFLVISLVIVFFLIGIVVYSMIIDRKREIVLFRINGLSDSQIGSIIGFDTILISVFSSCLVLLVINGINKVINYFIYYYFGLDNLLVVDFKSVVVLIIVSFVFGYLFSKVPMYLLFKKKEIELMR